MTLEAPNIRILKNGAHYDMDRKRIVANPGGGLAAFNPETARVAQAQKLERKRARLVEGANKTLERSGLWETPDDLDMVEAIGETVMIKAMNASDPKQVDAARFLLQESGLAEPKQAQTEAQDVLHGLASLVRELAQFARGIEPETVDGTVSEDV